MCGNRAKITNIALSIPFVLLNKAIFGLGSQSKDADMYAKFGRLITNCYQKCKSLPPKCLPADYKNSSLSSPAVVFRAGID